MIYRLDFVHSARHRLHGLASLRPVDLHGLCKSSHSSAGVGATRCLQYLVHRRDQSQPTFALPNLRTLKPLGRRLQA